MTSSAFSACSITGILLRTFCEVKGIIAIAYVSEAWVMNRCDENMINIFERKILRKIFGAVREGDHWRAQ
jgi:hypothetical protein